MHTCSTKKTCFKNKEEAEEELINIRGRNNYSGSAGPINVYKCEFCGFYHFTSKGEANPILTKDENLTRINKVSEANFWIDKLK